MQARRPIVLSLDLATVTGWCEGELGQRPTYGSVRLRGSSFGARFAALVDFVQLRLESPAPPDQVVFESPVPNTSDKGGINQGRLGIGYASMIEYACYRLSVSCFESSVSRSRKKVTGRGGGFGSRDGAKRHVVEWCRANGFDPHDDNAADAIILWKHAELVGGGAATVEQREDSRQSWMVPA